MRENEESNVMSRFRSISYAPRSTEDFYGAANTSLAHRPEWTLCRKFKELPIEDNSMLRRWTEQGRILPDDYLVHRELDVCVQARDIAELAPVFLKARAHRIGRISLALSLAAALLSWLMPLLGGSVLVGAMVSVVLSTGPSRRCSYRLYTAGEHGATLRPPRADSMSMLWPS